MAILRACTQCGTLSDKPRCPQHRKDNRPSATKRGYGTEWRKTRARFLRDNPYCTFAGGCIDNATDVHHLDGQGPNGPRGHDFTNLQGLCHRHHSEVTSQEQPGGWNVR